MGPEEGGKGGRWVVGNTRVGSYPDQKSAGLDIGLTGNVSLVLDGFYNLGLTKIDDSGVNDDVKNRAFSILAGLSFAVGE